MLRPVDRAMTNCVESSSIANGRYRQSASVETEIQAHTSLMAGIGGNEDTVMEDFSNTRIG